MRRLPAPRRLAMLVLSTSAAFNLADAASPESVSDARCLIVAVSLLQSPNNTTRAAAASSALYYLGRLDGREPDVDLQKLVQDEVKKLSPEDIQSEAQRCGHFLSARGKVVSDIGKALAK